MNGPSAVTLVLGTSDRRLEFLAWCAANVGGTFSLPECCDAYGGSGAQALVGQLVQAGVLTDVSPPSRYGRGRPATRFVTIEPDPCWAIVRKIAALVQGAA